MSGWFKLAVTFLRRRLEILNNLRVFKIKPYPQECILKRILIFIASKPEEDKLGYKKIQNFYSTKDKVNKMER